ncbi:MAG: sulfotransferase [Bacteroidota bacterium]
MINNKKAKFLLKSRILKTKDFQPKNSILIFSEPRSGSTWLAELLQYLPNSIIHWEPLNPQKGSVPEAYNWGWRPFLAKEKDNQEVAQFMEQLLRFSKATTWTSKYVSVKTAMKAQWVIHKIVRGNLMLPWILKHLPLERPPILLLRHPITTCQSQIKNFNINPDKIELTPNGVNEQAFEQHLDFLKGLSSVLEVKVAYWCMNHAPILQDKDSLNQCCIVHYEDLVVNPTEEFKRIAKTLELPLADADLQKLNFRKASASDFKKNFSDDIQTQLNKGLNLLDDQVKHRIQQVFDYFELKCYDAFSVLKK